MPPPATLLSVSPEVFDDPAPLSPERLRAVVALLDPGSRALLDLSLRWGVGDERMAGLLRTGAADIARRRAGVIEHVAGQLGVDPLEGLGRLRSALADLPAEAWGIPPPSTAQEIVDEPPAPPRERAAEPSQSNRGADLPVPPSNEAPSTALEPARPRHVAVEPTVAPPQRRRGRAMLALAVGALVGAALGRRFR